MSDTTNAVATADTAPGWWTAPDVDEVEGFDLVKDEALLALVGVPFMIHNVTFRDGIQRPGAPYRSDYVSLELTVAPAPVLSDAAQRIATRRATHKITLEGMARAEEQLVVNDGSTGIYRQIMQYLLAKQLITLPEEAAQGSTEGAMGETIYDLPRSEWATGADEATEGIDIRLRCSRGLRFSDYDNPAKPSDIARTFYIA